MQSLKPTQSIDNNGGSNTSSQYVKPFAVDDKGLAPSQKYLIDKLIRQLHALTGQSTDEIWLLLREHLGLSKNMSLTFQHFSAAEFFLQQKIQYAQQGGSQNLLEKIMTQLSQGENKEKIMTFMRQTFGHTALSLLNENELRQVLEQLPKSSTPPLTNSPINGKTGSANTQQAANTTSMGTAQPSFSSIPMPEAQVKIINQLVYNLSQLLNEPQAKITEQLFKLLKHPIDAPLLNQQFKMASEFLQTRILVAQEEFHPVNNLITLLQPLSKNEQQFIQQYVQQHFNLSITGMLNMNQADKLVIELFTKRASGKTPWQIEGNITPILSGLIPELKTLVEKPSFISGLFAFVLFFIFLFLILSV